jgi:hypothetical protein
MPALNQKDPNDRLLPLNGLDVVTNEDVSLTAVNDANIDINGNVFVNGIPFGSGGGVTGYVHTQGSSSATWTINHNLGYKPIVQVFNAGSIQVLAEIEDVTINQTVVRIAPAQTGFARLI